MGSVDLGTIVGALAGGFLVAATGVGIPLVVTGAAVGAYAGNYIAKPHHYKPMYQH